MVFLLAVALNPAALSDLANSWPSMEGTTIVAADLTPSSF